MAERRMFSKKVIDSDKFLDMPLSAQNVYFHLSMRADDDGFLNNAQKTIRMIGAAREDYDVLLSCGFIIDFGNGVCVITHWNMNNYIRSDRYKETVHQDEKNRLVLTKSKIYELAQKRNEAEDEAAIDIIAEETSGIPHVSILETQYSSGKVSEDKDSEDKNITCNQTMKPESESEIVMENTDYEQEIMNKWNSIGISKISSIQNNRKKLLKARVAEHGINHVLKAVDNINKSAFLKGQNPRGWLITFDWLIRPNNFIKVLEGNYDDKKNLSVLHHNSYENNNKGKSGFCDFPQRDYDYDKLERKLLGWE